MGHCLLASRKGSGLVRFTARRRWAKYAQWCSSRSILLFCVCSTDLSQSSQIGFTWLFSATDLVCPRGLDTGSCWLEMVSYVGFVSSPLWCLQILGFVHCCVNIVCNLSTVYQELHGAVHGNPQLEASP